jgi:hypothetical protein
MLPLRITALCYSCRQPDDPTNFVLRIGNTTGDRGTTSIGRSSPTDSLRAYKPENPTL